MQMDKPTSNQLLKSINQQKVLRLIYTQGPITRVELAERTGLTQQTITNIVNRFLEEQTVKELTPKASSGGRKPVPLVVDGSNMYAIGIEVAVQYIRGSVLDFHNNQIKEITIAAPKPKDNAYPLQYIYKAIDELIANVPDRSRLKGIGCSIQGLVDSKQGVVIYSPGLGWRQYPLREELAGRYDLPVYLENDVNLLALVENLNGSLAASTHNITLKFDYGIGGALVVGGQLCSGAGYVAGEFGHYKAAAGDEAKLCHCGAKGCLTTIASISGLRKHEGVAFEQFEADVRANGPDNDPRFLKMMDAVGRAVSNLVTFINPEHVLLTGRLIDQMGDLIIPRLTAHIEEWVPESCRRDGLLMRLPQTPNDSISAAGLVMNHFFDVPLEKLSLQ